MGQAAFQGREAQFQRYAAHSYGRSLSINDTCDAIEQYASAAEELPADAETRIKEIAAALEFAKTLESITEEKFKAQVEPEQSWNRVQYTRAEIEIRLKRVHRELVLERSRE